MATAWELSRPEHQGRFEVTVYQEGWRLGGKGASGRGPSGRIEEHGLHIWFGFYDNAFRLMREVYAELAAAGDHRFGDWREAWIPESDIGLMSPTRKGGWERWSAHFAPRPGLPGDPVKPEDFLDLRLYLTRAVDVMATILLDTRVERREPGEPALVSDIHEAAHGLRGLAGFGLFAGRASLAQGLAALCSAVAHVPAAPDSAMLRGLERICAEVRDQIESRWLADAANHHVYELADLTVATVLGLFRDGVLWDPRGLDALEDFEGRAWLLRHGASERSIQAPYIRGLYDLSMGYEEGDPLRPNLSAGQGLRGILRTFFGYRGALMWRMCAGMGDVVFAPLYEALRRRGVRFEFFHRLTNVGLGAADGDAARQVVALQFDVQAQTADGGPYEPLVVVKGRPCWPAAPKYDLLADGARAQAEGWAFESFWDRRCAGHRVLGVGADFDAVVLGVGLGAVPHVCAEFLARDPRWLAMSREVKTVASQAFQVWLTKDLGELGWAGPPWITGAFAKPFDTWCDMAQVTPAEDWAEPPAASVYFCAALPDPPHPPADDDRDYPARRDEEVRAAAIDFLRWPMPVCWPGAVGQDGDFDWSLLAHASGSPGPCDERRFSTQYWRANVNPSDRYVIHTPGSTRFRISPLDTTYANFTLVGDGTLTNFHSGCVEAAVMSGLLGAHSLSGSPRLEDITAYDHP
jgi:uncharacterized protein with NAD-binding domain and iron-sulfur cluster